MLLLRRLRGTESWPQIGERFGLGDAPSLTGQPVVWVHGASLGEMTAARPFIEKLVCEIEGLHVVVTVNTVTAREMISNWENPAITTHLAPLDYSGVLRRFLQTWNPLVAINLENEIWPLRLQTCRKQGVAVFMLGGRISENTLKNWSRRHRFTKNLMESISYLAPIDCQNGKRFLHLGLAPNRVGKPVNLKSAVRLTGPNSETLSLYQKIFEHQKTYLAASTHVGDEKLILASFSEALKNNSEIKLILAPRHPHRGDEITQLIESNNLNHSRRSLGQEPVSKNSVYLVDTVGEMPLWYSLAKATIIGGTFSDVGGHTPVEPVQFNSIVVHGPDTVNNTEAFAALHSHSAAISVADNHDLRAIFENDSPTLGQTDICKKATNAVHELRIKKSDTREFIEKVKAYVFAKQKM